jgi:membrane protein DedA with SNARE-associated domain
MEGVLMIDERIFKVAIVIFSGNLTTLGWVLIKVLTKYQEMVSPIGSYLLSLMIIQIVMLGLLIIGRKKLIKIVEKESQQ